MQRGILLEIPGFQTQFYQLLTDEITSFFCLSDKQCNELFKRHLTFSNRSNIIVITANNVRWRIETFIWDTLNTHFVPSYSSSYYSLIFGSERSPRSADVVGGCVGGLVATHYALKLLYLPRFF